MVYGYCRVSTPRQKMERQVENILRRYPEAKLYRDACTGTTMTRPAWKHLRKIVRQGDTIVFDEVSRMSRDAVDGVQVYMELYAEGVDLVFLKEPHINTEVYRQRMQEQVQRIAATGNPATDHLLDAILTALEQYTRELAAEQITLAFRQAEAELRQLHQRTSEGVQRAKAEGKQVGRAAGVKVETRKAKAAKEVIRKHSRDFGGSLTDKECMKLAGCARNAFYRYKRQMKTET